MRVASETAKEREARFQQGFVTIVSGIRVSTAESERPTIFKTQNATGEELLIQHLQLFNRLQSNPR
jgi:hypothetical protein